MFVCLLRGGSRAASVRPWLSPPASAFFPFAAFDSLTSFTPSRWRPCHGPDRLQQDLLGLVKPPPCRPSPCTAFASSTVLSSLLSVTAWPGLSRWRRFLSSLVVLRSASVVLPTSNAAASGAGTLDGGRLCVQEPINASSFLGIRDLAATGVLQFGGFGRGPVQVGLDGLACRFAESHALDCGLMRLFATAAAWRVLICSPIQDTAMRSWP